jgi:hypothetical protein
MATIIMLVAVLAAISNHLAQIHGYRIGVDLSSARRTPIAIEGHFTIAAFNIGNGNGVLLTGIGASILVQVGYTPEGREASA